MSQRKSSLTWMTKGLLALALVAMTLPGGAASPVPATRIGQVEPRSFVPLFVDGEPIANSEGLGWQHR